MGEIMKTPIIDNRKFNDLVDQIEKMVPYYTPEWRFNRDNPDVGTTLYMIMALQMEETIDLLNETLDNHFLAYLNLIQLKLRPSKPARVPLVFNLSEGANRIITMPKGNRMIGNSEKIAEKVSFELEEELNIFPSKLEHFLEGNQLTNSIRKLKLDSEKSLFLETGNIQKNIIYFASNSLLNLVNPSKIHILFIDSNEEEIHKIADKNFVDWQYLSNEEWIPFDDISFEVNRITLSKKKSFPIIGTEGNRINLIRGMLKDNALKELKDIRLKGIKCKSELILEEAHGIKTDLMHLNGEIIRRSKIYPFGVIFSQLSTFSIFSNDVFSKRGAKIELRFTIDFEENKSTTIQPNIDWKLVMKKSEFHRLKENEISVFDVKWKYYNGFSWVPLTMPVKHERIFYYQNGLKEVVVTFTCPEDIAPYEGENSELYGIQAEVQRIENEYAPNGIYMTPIVSELSVNYHYEIDRVLDDIYTYNNLERQSLYMDLVNQNKEVTLFKGLSIDEKAIYLMLDNVHDSGNLNVLFALKRKLKFENAYNLNVSVLTRDNENYIWEDTDFLDGTMGITRTGILKIMLDKRYRPVSYFNEEGVWLRIELLNLDRTVECILEHVSLNAVWGKQVHTMEEEYLPYEVDRTVYQLNAFPVHDVDIYVNEVDSLSQTQAEELIKSDTITKFKRNEYGLVEEIWVKWDEVESFVYSKHNDRIYLLNHLTGELTFGDGKKSKKLPVGEGLHIRANYQTTYGKDGNLSENSIKQMEQSRAFVDQVFNPISAEGGTSFESMDSIRKRGLVKIRTKGVPISSFDYEELILTQFPNIQRIKCYGNRNEEFDYCPGRILIVIVPHDKPSNGIDFESQIEITRFLSNKIPAGLSLENVILMDPSMIEVSLSINMKVNDPSNRITVKQEVERSLASFLDYRTGALDGNGFDIGELPDVNSFFILFKDIENLDYIESLSVTLKKHNHDEIIEISVDEIDKILNGLVVNGKHRIQFI